MSLKEKLLKAGLKSEVVEVSGLKVECVELSVSDRIAILALSTDQKKFYPALIIACVKDPKTKEPIFKDGEEADILALGGAGVEKMAAKISDLSGISAAAKKALEKN